MFLDQYVDVLVYTFWLFYKQVQADLRAVLFYFLVLTVFSLLESMEDVRGFLRLNLDHIQKDLFLMLPLFSDQYVYFLVYTYRLIYQQVQADLRAVLFYFLVVTGLSLLESVEDVTGFLRLQLDHIQKVLYLILRISPDQYVPFLVRTYWLVYKHDFADLQAVLFYFLVETGFSFLESMEDRRGFLRLQLGHIQKDLFLMLLVLSYHQIYFSQVYTYQLVHKQVKADLRVVQLLFFRFFYLVSTYLLVYKKYHADFWTVRLLSLHFFYLVFPCCFLLCTFIYCFINLSEKKGHQKLLFLNKEILGV